MMYHIRLDAEADMQLQLLSFKLVIEEIYKNVRRRHSPPFLIKKSHLCYHKFILSK